MTDIITKTELILPFEYNNDNLLESFKTMVKDFCSLNKENYRDILYRRFGLEGKKPLSLDEIGILHNITRERVRQLEAKNINYLKTLINGDFIKKPFCRLNKELTDKILELKNKLLEYGVIDKNQLFSLLKNDYNILENDSNKGYITLILELFREKAYYEIEYPFNDQKFFIIDQEIDDKSFLLVCKNIVSILKENDEPIDQDDLYISVIKKSRSLKNISKKYISIACNFINDIEKISLNEKVLYRIKFHKLNSFPDYAYRILKEKNQKMHFNEIWSEISHELSHAEINNVGSIETLKNGLGAEKRFKNIGKTGFWSLTEWNFNTLLIIDLIITELRKINEASTYQTIFEKINLIRPDVSKSSMIATITNNKESFRKIDNKKIILKEWSFKYENSEKFETKRNKIDETHLNKALIEIFNESSEQKIKSGELKNRLDKKGINLKLPTFYSKINKCRILDKDNEFYSLKKENIDISEKKSKLDLIEEKIINYFNDNHLKSATYSQILSYLIKKFDYSKPSIYHVIRNSKLMKKTEDGNILLFIKESENILESEKPKETSHFLDLIKQGEENSYIEFKSTLKWNIKANMPDDKMEYVIFKALTGFLNYEGGTLFIGVENNGNIFGLEHDYSCMRGKSKDGFLTYFADKIEQYLGKPIFSLLKINIEKINEKEICIVEIKKSNKPVFFKDSEFFIRASASTRQLNMRETQDYIKTHWK